MKRKGLINSLLNNPVYLKEQYSLKRKPKLFKQVLFWTPLILVVSILGAISLYYRFFSLLKFRGRIDLLYPLFNIAVFMGFYFLFKAVTSTSSLITDEKERGTFQPLISSLMSPFEIITGKFLTVSIPIIKKFGLYSLLCLTIIISDGFEPDTLLFALIFGINQLTIIMTAIIITLWSSNRMSKSSDAGRLSIIIILFLLVLKFASWEKITEIFHWDLNPTLLLYSLFFLIIWLLFCLLLERDLSKIPAK